MRHLRYEKNPYLENMVIKFGTKRVKLSSLGNDNDVTLTNNTTGECYGTHVTTTKRVDTAKFIKLFTSNMAMTFNLTSQGIKVFTVLCWAVQEKGIQKDEIYLDSIVREDFIAAQKKAAQKEAAQKEAAPKGSPMLDTKVLGLSQATFSRGLTELTKAQIIAKTMRQGCYWINPNVIFNGDRIAFTTVIERNKETLDHPDQASLEDDSHLQGDQALVDGDSHLQEKLV